MQVKELVGILRHLDYAVYVAHNHNAAFEDLVNDVAGLFERAQDSDALAAAAAALAHCAQLPQLQLCEAATQTSAALRSKAVDKLDECAEQLSSISDAAMKVRARRFRNAHAQSLSLPLLPHALFSNVSAPAKGVRLATGRTTLAGSAGDGCACGVQKGVAALAEGTPAASAADDAGVAYVYALRGAVARVGRLATQEAWNTDLAADERVRASLHDIVAARLSGRPLPAEIVTDAVQALYFLLVVDVQRVHRMVGGRGGTRVGMSQLGTQAEVTAVAAASRSFVERVRVHSLLVCECLHVDALRLRACLHGGVGSAPVHLVYGSCSAEAECEVCWCACSAPHLSLGVQFGQLFPWLFASQRCRSLHGLHVSSVL